MVEVPTAWLSDAMAASDWLDRRNNSAAKIIMAIVASPATIAHSGTRGA